MGIQPIDLQTVFTQLDKVSKMQVQQTQAMQLQSNIEQAEIAKKEMLKQTTVREAKQIDDEMPTVKNDDARHSWKHEKGEKKEDDAQTEEKQKDFYSDPSLGQHIDISG